MKLIKKNNHTKTTQIILDDIRYSFNKIISQKHSILSITITNTNCKTSEELKFCLTNKLFNRIHKENKHTYEILNYLFVIEYPTKVSIGNQIPDNCEVHTHIVLGTTLLPQQIEYYIQTTFSNPNIYIEDITKRNDKENYINYLIKQRAYLTDNNYNYKIVI